MSDSDWAAKPEFWEAIASGISLIVSVVAVSIAKRDSSTREALNQRVDIIALTMHGIAAERDALEQRLAAQNQLFQRQLAQERALVLCSGEQTPRQSTIWVTARRG